MSGSSTIRVMVKWVTQPGKLDDVLHLLDGATRLSRAEPGNIGYQAYLSTTEENTLFLLEEYQNVEAAQAHKSSSHYQEIVAGQILPLLSSREVHIVNNI